ncbi:unnamed protein product [Owenia fusiformis]|uniref:VWFA domain-containing protein n=1 Tax=Owenia fusiformis TaxID=6347 RepID=A0A8S4Q7J3_OWEFU|nr:unnamed protein product [Owenia fusiformis]
MIYRFFNIFVLVWSIQSKPVVGRENRKWARQINEISIKPEDTAIKVVLAGNSLRKVNEVDGRGIDEGEFDVCADIEMILDISCSLSQRIKERSREIVKKITRSLLEGFSHGNNAVRIGLLTYGERYTHELFFNNTASIDETMDIIDKINLRRSEGDICRTYTHKALEQAVEVFKTSKHTTKIIHLYTDGLTVLRRYREDLYKIKDKLREDGVIINVIQQPHRKGKYEEEEYIELPHSADHLFKGTDPDIANFLVDRILFDAPCFDNIK